MKKIDGLRIDYVSGDAGVSLPAEFAGQSLEFQLVAVAYWISSLQEKLESITNAMPQAKRMALKTWIRGSTIEEVISQDQAIVMQFSDPSVCAKQLMVSVAMCFSPGSAAMGRDVLVWESSSRTTFTRIASIPVSSTSFKAVRRLALQIKERWIELKKTSIQMSSGRLGKESQIGHQVNDLSTYFCEKKVEEQ